uniref:LBH domain-containing protein n=1 Tax=Xiphophorus couchianus TaxID=32473 RepID=A0A3B5KUZ6_9TELE
MCFTLCVGVLLARICTRTGQRDVGQKIYEPIKMPGSSMITVRLHGRSDDLTQWNRLSKHPNRDKERLPSIVVEPTEVSEVESGELRWKHLEMNCGNNCWDEKNKQTKNQNKKQLQSSKHVITIIVVR